ncbi:MAG: class I SAM-dependent methyltransferase [Proteobacteria bacterium]|nr:class I SAM-dependent methyltransferase [Pseudomonadota bacterium]
MLTLAPAPHALNGQLVTLADGSQLLWQPMTGRHLRIDDETPLASPPAALRHRLDALGFTDSPSQANIPARSRWALLFPGTDGATLWHPCPLARGAGGFPFAEMKLDAEDVTLWRSCDGRRDLTALAEATGLTASDIASRLARWTDIAVQAVQLRERPIRRREPALMHLVASARPDHTREEHHYAEGATTLATYHEQQITDGSTHFDDRETTFAHAFATPHPALDNLAYGAALGTALRDRLPDGPILEIGPGTGQLCEAFRSVIPDTDYTRLDLSPELLATQAARCPGTRSLQGSATAIPLDDASIAVVLSNEVIADLRASPTAEGWAVTAEPGQALFNTGAFAMMEEVARVLRPGGLAFISEFGGPDELPVETTHLDHPEVSIHFGQVAAVAASAGLQVELLPLDAVLPVDRSAHWLSRPSYEALRARFHSQGRHLQARAYSENTLDLPWPVEGLHWVGVDEPGCAPVLDRVWVLLARKP